MFLIIKFHFDGPVISQRRPSVQITFSHMIACPALQDKLPQQTFLKNTNWAAWKRCKHKNCTMNSQREKYKFSSPSATDEHHFVFPWVVFYGAL